MRRLVGYFFQGFLYIAPLGVTIYVFWAVFNLVDAPLRWFEEGLFGGHIPGLGLLAVLGLLTAIGWLGTTIIAQPVKVFFRRVLDRAPLIGGIEGAVRELLSTLFSKERRFKHPVLVRVNTISDLEKVGFITQEDLSELGVSGKVAVYFPHSYNFSGELFIVPREHVRPLDVPARDAMKFIVSGGVLSIGGRRRSGREHAGDGLVEPKHE